MRPFYLAFGMGFFRDPIAYFMDRLEFIGHLNYLTLVLIGFGLFVFRHLGRVYLLRTEPKFFSGAFIGKAIGILGFALGVPLLL